LNGGKKCLPDLSDALVPLDTVQFLEGTLCKDIEQVPNFEYFRQKNSSLIISMLKICLLFNFAVYSTVELSVAEM
jgi:hypothetical protein